MDTGIVVAIVSGCAVVIAGIFRITSSRVAPTNGNRAVTQSECVARMETSGAKIGALGEKVDTLQLNVNAGFDRIEAAVKERNERE